MFSGSYQIVKSASGIASRNNSHRTTPSSMQSCRFTSRLVGFTSEDGVDNTEVESTTEVGNSTNELVSTAEADEITVETGIEVASIAEARGELINTSRHTSSRTGAEMTIRDVCKKWSQQLAAPAYPLAILTRQDLAHS